MINDPPKEKLSTSRGEKPILGDEPQKAPPVLIVDDTQFNIEMVQMQLQAAGVESDAAPGGQEALDLINTRLEECYKDSGVKMYKVILLDYSMPKMDGPEAAIKMRKMLENNILVETQMPYIVCWTAYNTPSHKQKALEAGMDSFLNKPLHQKDLKKLLIKLRK